MTTCPTIQKKYHPKGNAMLFEYHGILWRTSQYHVKNTMVFSKQRGPRYKSNQIILMMPLLNLDNLSGTYYQTSLITQMIWLVKHTVVLSCHIFRWIEPPPQTSVKREDEEKRQKAWMSHSCVRQRSWPLSSCAGVSYGHYSQTTHLREKHSQRFTLTPTFWHPEENACYKVAKVL